MYVGCDTCSNWFHLSCVGLSPFQAKYWVLSYACVECCSVHGRKSYVRGSMDPFLVDAWAAVQNARIDDEVRSAYIGDPSSLPCAIVVGSGTLPVGNKPEKRGVKRDYSEEPAPAAGGAQHVDAALPATAGTKRSRVSRSDPPESNQLAAIPNGRGGRLKIAKAGSMAPARPVVLSVAAKPSTDNTQRRSRRGSASRTDSGLVLHVRAIARNADSPMWYLCNPLNVDEPVGATAMQVAALSPFTMHRGEAASPVIDGVTSAEEKAGGGDMEAYTSGLQWNTESHAVTARSNLNGHTPSAAPAEEQFEDAFALPVAAVNWHFNNYAPSEPSPSGVSMWQAGGLPSESADHGGE
jgi:hypothetical protein